MMIEFCTGLEHLTLPDMDKDIPEAKGIQRFREILEKEKHKKLRYLNTSQICVPGFARDFVIQSLCELSIKHNLSLINFCCDNLCCSDIQVTAEVRDRLLSILCVNLYEHTSALATLPNIEKADALLCSGIDSMESLKRALTPAAFSSLRKLELQLSESPSFKDTLWERFPNLEELSLTFGWDEEEKDANNPVFFGSNFENPAFLQLVGKFLYIISFNTSFKMLA